MSMRIRFIACLFLGLSHFACQENKTTVFIVDTSGSMKKDGLLDNVKQSMKKLSFDYHEGDTFTLITFDSETRFELSQVVRTNSDLYELNSRIDAIQAKGNWTNLKGVIDYSLDLVTRELLAKDSQRKVDIVLYTDGIHDPPPHLKGKEELNFEQLFQKYFSKTSNQPWFVYYVELDKVDRSLAEAIQASQRGRLVGKSELQTGMNFTQEVRPDQWPLAAAVAFGLLIVGYAAYFKRTAFKRGLLVPDSKFRDNVIDLSKIRLPPFGRSIKIGSQGEVNHSVATRQARIGIGLSGAVYLKPVSGSLVYLDGQLIDKKQKLQDGQKFDINGHAFTYHDRKAS
ncbi:VWA domain-containing protein [Oligoflexus tunisiensis]|uniref:VWA domain-containing protein n=1 Tax=Oligoflexus tunisiensis TaxID=708132 RepID=UPI00114D212C|nr:VWA domain-containing protein [Oligoflexus tunisiensis]